MVRSSLTGRAKCDHNDAASTNMGSEPQKGRDRFTWIQKLESDDERIEWFDGDERIEVGRDKVRPVALTGYRGAFLGEVDRF